MSDPGAIRQYLLVTGNYWAFTLTDGALRMLVVLYFHQLGYAPLAIAMLFLFYEFFGIVTNLIGGWLGARIGLNRTMNIGLGLQVAALAMLTLPAEYLSIPYVMVAQALSGIAKDLNKMSAKSSIKLLAAGGESALYRWVALLTGSKNALKGVGFFLGGALLAGLGFQRAMAAMAAALLVILGGSLVLLRGGLGVANKKTPFRDIFSKSRAVNLLSAARLFLFGARDIWFVVALPVFMSEAMGWSHTAVGGFMACWIIGYGVIQSVAPALTGKRAQRPPDGGSALFWAALLTAVPVLIALAMDHLPTAPVLLGGVLLFGVVFALNSALHSYLILSYARVDGVSLDVGFYYMANAAGRLLGTVLSGGIYQQWGMAACLWGSALMLLITVWVSLALPRHGAQKSPQ